MAFLSRLLKVWALRLTIHCLADAGNMLDCACLAGIVALKHFRRPDVEVVGDEVTIVGSPFSLIYQFLSSSSMVLIVDSILTMIYLQHAPTERAPVPLSIHHTPFCFTFAFFPPTSSQSFPITVVDPSHPEQRFSTGAYQ